MTAPRSFRKTISDLAPDDLVKTCKYIEMGSYFAIEGVRCCVHGNIQSPLLVAAEEIRSHAVTYDVVVQRRKKLFAAINGLGEGQTDACATCTHLKQAKFKDIRFDYLGGEPLPGALGIQHYTECNQRCAYCCYAQADNMVKPQYDVLDYLELFRKQGKLRGNNWIDFSGGEPAMLVDFDRILSYLLDHKLGTVVVYSNASIFSQSIYNALKDNRIILTTSVDTGIPSTYAKLRGTNVFPKVIRNLIRYRNSGTKRLWLKYVITERNRTEDDLWSFVLAMLALKPDRLMICPDFPYGEQQVPDETTKFAARLWYILEKLTGLTPADYTSEFGDPLWLKYREDLNSAIEDFGRQHPLGNESKIESLAFPAVCGSPKTRLATIKQKLLGSEARKRLLPVGSAREKHARRVWRKTLGRLLPD